MEGRINATMMGNHFAHNMAYKNGGAVVVNRPSALDIRGCVFIRNRATENAGALRFRAQPRQSFEFEGNMFEHNRSGKGIVKLHDCKLCSCMLFLLCLFTPPYIPYMPCVHVSLPCMTCFCLRLNNIATGQTSSSGGAIHALKSRIAMENCTCIYNTATGSGQYDMAKGYSEGGGCAFSYASAVSIQASTISFNRANKLGGGLCCGYSTHTIIINGTVIEGNTAGTGGGVWVGYSGCTVTDTCIIDITWQQKQEMAETSTRWHL